MLKVAVLLSLLVYSPSRTSVYGYSYSHCFDLLCELEYCPNRTCFCVNFQDSSNYLERSQLRCPEINIPPVQLSYDVITKELQFPCNSEVYHPQFIIHQILPHFTKHQIQKLRICLFDDKLNFQNINPQTLSPRLVKILQDMNFLEISIRDGFIREELIEYMVKTIPSLKEVSFNNTPIAEPKENMLKILTNVGFINLHGYNSKTIESGFFQSMETVNVLDLSDNDIEALREDIFWTLENVTKIDLSNNRIQELSSKLFRDCNKLEELHIHNNQLASLPIDIFNNLKSLRKIVIMKNRLTKMEVGLFDNVTNLHELDLSDNNLHEIPFDIFKFNRKLINIKLNFNKISNADFSGISEDASIYLENNNIDKDTFHMIRFPKIKRISLNNNCLYTNIFNIDGYISEVSLKNCCLNRIPNFQDRIYNSLDLRNNNINTVTMADLTNSSNLRILDLRENKIGKFDFTWDYPLLLRNQSKTPTTKVLIDGNPIVCDCNVTVLYEFLRLKSNRSQASDSLSNLEFNAEQLFCSSPPYLRGKALQDIPYSEVQCSRVFIDCPERCLCTINADNMIIDCKNKSLTNFPEIFPPSTELLHLQFENNNLKDLPYWNSSFWDRAEVISLDNNLISSLRDFKLSPKLKKLSLNGNQLSNIEPTLKEVLLAKQNIALTLSNNPWLCDCDSAVLISKSDEVTDKQFLKCTEISKREQILNSKFVFEFCKELNEKDNSLVIYIPVSLGVILIVCVTFILCYRFKAKIRAWLFARG